MSQKKWVIGLMIVAAMAILSVIGLFIYLLTPQIYSGHIDHVGQLVERSVASAAPTHVCHL